MNGESTDIENILAWMAKCEKLGSRVEEPLEVRGHMTVALPPNTMGDEAFTACFYAFSFNGLGFSGIAEDLVLVRPEKHPRVELQGRPWNRDQILATELFHLGYLKPDPIMRQYRDKMGSAGGHALIVLRPNVLIVTDTPRALKSLRLILTRKSSRPWACRSRRDTNPATLRVPPSLGAIASREAIHFYLMAFARWNHFPLAATEQKNQTATLLSRGRSLDGRAELPGPSSGVPADRRIRPARQGDRRTGVEWAQPRPLHFRPPNRDGWRSASGWPRRRRPGPRLPRARRRREKR